MSSPTTGYQPDRFQRDHAWLSRLPQMDPWADGVQGLERRLRDWLETFRATLGGIVLEDEERYRDRDDYLEQVRAAAEQLVTDRFLLARDVEVLVANCAARWDALVPAVVA